MIHNPTVNDDLQNLKFIMDTHGMFISWDEISSNDGSDSCFWEQQLKYKPIEKKVFLRLMILLVLL